MFSVFLVHGQQVTAEHQNVVGTLGKSVQFQWVVNRGNSSFNLQGLNLFNGTSPEDQKLFELNKNQPAKQIGTSDRLNAVIVGDLTNETKVTYNLVLDNLQFYDENTSFYLFAIFFGLSKLVSSGALVTLTTVKGMHFFSV